MAEASLFTVNSMHSPMEEDSYQDSGEGQGQGESIPLSQKTSTSKKKKSKYDLLEEKWNSKFSELDAKLDNKLDSMFDKFFAKFQGVQEQKSTENGDDNFSDADIEGTSQRRVDKTVHQSQRHSTADFPLQVSENEDCGVVSEDDNVSLQPGQAEKEDLLHQDIESDDNNTEENLSEKTKKCLFELFGEDAIAKKNEKKEGIVMDQSQKEVLLGHWRAEKPNLITAFSEETLNSFPVDEETEKFLQVPTLDELIGRCLVKRHGNKASFSKSGRTLFSQPYKMLEKIAYRGQQAAYVGIISNMYVQQSLGSLIELLTDEHFNRDKAIQQVRDTFAMSTKCLDQLGRTGAFHHILRRQMCMTDTTLFQLEDSRDISDLPLTGDGVFGEKLESSLKSRKEKNKTIDDLLPDLGKYDRKRKTIASDKAGPSTKKPNMRGHTENDNTNAKTKDDGFRFPKKTNSATGFQRKDGAKFTKPEGRQPKSDNSFKKGNFPPRGGKANRS